MNSTPAMQERLEPLWMKAQVEAWLVEHATDDIRYAMILASEIVYDYEQERRRASEQHRELARLLAESRQHEEALESTLHFASTYRGYEARPCPLCKYENGVFIDLCQMHKDMHALHTRIAELERELATAQAWEAAQSSSTEEVRAIVTLWRNDIADRAASFLSLNAENVRGIKYQMEVQLIDAWLDSIKETPNA